MSPSQSHDVVKLAMKNTLRFTGQLASGRTDILLNKS
jgi:hypothetical protein